MSIRKIIILAALIGVCACSKSIRTETYTPAFRQLPPEPLYSRVMISNPPQPIPSKSFKDTPLIAPIFHFDLPDSNLEEAILALAQTIGYQWDVPSRLAAKTVSINEKGTVDEILDIISQQAGVVTELDHERRLVRVIDDNTIPRLSAN